MANYNKVLLMGRLTRDIELKYTPSSQAVANIGLAVNNRYKTKDGEDKEETTFVDCEAWGRTAEVLKQYLAKGKPVFIEGRLKLDQWDDKQTQQKRSRLGVVLESFNFLDGGNREGGDFSGGGGGTSSAPSARPGKPASSPPPNNSGEGMPPEEDDVPF